MPLKPTNSVEVASFTDAWIETSEVIQRLYVFLVASFTDAWIETNVAPAAMPSSVSHLLQMRGLKRLPLTLDARTLKSHLLQMRGLKLIKF